MMTLALAKLRIPGYMLCSVFHHCDCDCEIHDNMTASQTIEY